MKAREEIIQAISDDKMMPFIQPEQLAEIVDFVIKNYNPSLPSNLDEAAVQEHIRMEESGEEMTFLNTFKAGAEWQYQKDRGEFAKLKAKEWSDGYNEGIAKGKEQMMKEAEECYVEWYDGLYLNLTTEQMSNAIERAGAKVGDKVIVQIRKANEKEK